MTVDSAPRTPTLPELFDIHADAVRRSVNVALPGRIEKYDSSEQKADVKPLLKDLVAMRDGEELLEVLPVIPAVPVVFPRAGGFFITLPVAAGDHVLLLFNDRSIDNFKASLGADTDPDDFRTHDFSDAVAFVGFYPFTKPVGDSGVGSNLVIGKESGAQIHIKPDLVSLYEENAADYMARADRSDADDVTIKTDINNLRTSINGWAPVPNDGGAALKIALAAWLASAINLSGSAADKVRGT
jgi:hypothetical protein